MNEVITEVVEDGIFLVTMNRPDVRNAVNLSMAQGIADALERLDSDSSLRVGILTGANGTFSAGMDLSAIASGQLPRLPGRGFAGIAEHAAEKPLIAAVEGHAVGGGFEIALACDLIVAGSTATFALPEVRRGLVARAGGLLRLTERIPRQLAVELALTGESMSADRAATAGLLSRMVEPGEAVSAAIEIARVIAANAPLAVRISKQIMTESRDWPLAEQFQRQAKLADPVFASADAHEGAAAFKAKREPAWRGQ